MEQKDFARNISGTACVLGLVLSTMSANSTLIVNANSNYGIQKLNFIHDESSTYPFAADIRNIYETYAPTRLEEDAYSLFGEMRNATPEEQASINRYIKSISRDTGVNFFDIC